MLPLAFLVLGCAALQIGALPTPALVGPPLVQYQAKDELGQYRYGYSGGPSAKHEERTLDGVTRGSYSYIDGNGIVQTRAYEADDYNGFRVVGTDIAAPTGVSRSGTILSSTGLPVTDHSPVVKAYQPAGLSYIKAGGYNDVPSFSGNEISVAPVAYSVRKTYTPYSTPVEYLGSPYKYRVISEPSKYYKQHYISPNSLQVSSLSSVGVRVPTAYAQAQPVQTIAYPAHSVPSTVSPPTIYATQVPVTVAPPVQTVSIRESPIPVRASYTPTYQTAASQIVSSYVPRHAATAAPIAYRATPVVAASPVAYRATPVVAASPVAYRATPVVAASSVSYRATPAVAASSVSYRPPAVGILNTNPAPISYLDAAPGPIAVSTSAPPTVAIAEAAPAVVAYTKAAPAVSYATAAPPTVALSDPAPIAVYTSAPEVTYTSASPVVTYSSALPSVVPAVSYASPAVTYTSAVPFTYSTGSTPFTYGYNPTTSHIIRYANTAPSVRATIYEPAGGYTAANPIPLQEAIASQYHAQDELGQYRYGYANINSAKEETKTIDGVTRGSFSYVDANGILQSRSYVSDDVNGFRVIGTDIPKDPNGHVNPDAIPSEHVAPAVAAAAPASVAAVHSQQVFATAVPATLLSHNAVEVSPSVVISSTPATLSILK